MKRDKLFQHQKARLENILFNANGMWVRWGTPTEKGKRVIEMIYQASLRSIDRFRMGWMAQH